jgi:hypothetical protein
MACCVGKARIFYQEPLGFKLIYSGSANGEVLAQEPLMFSCIEIRPQIPANLYQLTIDFTAVSVDWRYNTYSESGTVVINNLTAPIVVYTETSTRYNWFDRDVIHHNLIYEDANQAQLQEIQAGGGGYAYRESIEYSWFTTRMDQQLDPAVYDFKVIGKNTGTIYQEISGLPSCPAVDNLGCVMGEENYYDTLLPNQTPGGPIESSCFKKIPAENNCFHVVLETKYRPDAFSDIPHEKLRPPKIETRSQLYLCGLPGCPAEYRIVCCPDGECEPERCPPDTDCELDCGSFVCCYKNGKVIKTVRK